jgi:hypothetical protein
LLAYGRYTDSTAEFPVTVDGTRRRVHVTDEHSVLGVVEAWQEHRRSRPGTEVLVIATSVREEDLGWDVRAYGRRSSICSSGLNALAEKLISAWPSANSPGSLTCVSTGSRDAGSPSVSHADTLMPYRPTGNSSPNLPLIPEGQP